MTRRRAVPLLAIALLVTAATVAIAQTASAGRLSRHAKRGDVRCGWRSVAPPPRSSTSS